MFAKKKSGLVEFPDRDPKVQGLRAELLELDAELGRLSVKIERNRGRIDTLTGNESAGGPPTRDQRIALGAEIDEAEARRKEVRERYRQLSQYDLRAARQAACKRIAAHHAPAFNKAAAAFVLARIERLSPEIVAAVHIRSIRDQFGGLRIAMRDMPMPHSVNLDATALDQLKEDAEALLAAKVIKRSDLPKQVVEAWGL